MENKSSGWCSLSGVILIIMGISCLGTLILIPLAIYCFIGASKYFAWSKFSDVQMSSQKNSLKNWAIFTSIVAFPVGLVSIIPAVQSGNNTVVTDVKVEPVLNEEQQKSDNEPKIKEDIPKKEEKPIKQVSNKEETIEKLKRFRDEGLITKEEYNKAIKELQGEN